MSTAIRHFFRLQNYRALVIIAYGAIIVTLLCVTDFHELINEGIGRFSRLGGAGHVLFFFSLMLAIGLLLPSSPLELSAGILFPFWLAIVYCVVAEAAGACIALWLGRYVLPARWRDQLLASSKIRQLLRIFAYRGWRMVLLTRLMPFFPVKTTNLVYGFTGIHAGHFFLGSLIGIIPRITLIVYLGKIAGHMAGAKGAHPVPGMPIWALWATGVVMLVCVVLIGRLVRRALMAENDDLRGDNPPKNSMLD